VADGGYSVVLTRRARDELAALPRWVQARVARALDGLATDPRPRAAKLLAGNERIWRVRVGDFRVLYEIQVATLVVLVIRVRHRRGAYRR